MIPLEFRTRSACAAVAAMAGRDDAGRPLYGFGGGVSHRSQVLGLAARALSNRAVTSVQLSRAQSRST